MPRPSSTRASSLTFLDCPGAVDFAQEARNVLLGVDAAVVVVEPVLERMITVSPLAQVSRCASDPAPDLHQQDGPLRGRLPRSVAEPARPVRPARHPAPVRDRPRRQLVGYIDLVTEQAYSYNDGAPSDSDRSAGGVSRARAGGAHRDARDARRLRRRSDGDAARGAGAAGRRHPPAHAEDAGRRPDRAGVHGRGRARHGRAAAARGADQGDPAARGRRGADRRRSVRRRPSSRCSRTIICRTPASSAWRGSGPARSRTA